MTRKEQIEEEKLRRYGDSDSACAYGQRMGFVSGAEWAAENPEKPYICSYHREERNSLEAKLAIAVEALKEARKYICERTNSCMRHPEGMVSTSHGINCIETSEAIAKIDGMK